MDYELTIHILTPLSAETIPPNARAPAKSPPTRRPRAPAAISPEQDPDLFLVKLWLDRESSTSFANALTSAAMARRRCRGRSS